MPSCFGLLAAGYCRHPLSFTDSNIRVPTTGPSWTRNRALSFSQRRPLLLFRHLFFSLETPFTPVKRLHSVLPSQSSNEIPRELTATSSRHLGSTSSLLKNPLVFDLLSLKTKAAGSSEKLVNMYQATRLHISHYVLLNLPAFFTEQVGVTVTIQTCIRDVLGTIVALDTGYPVWGFYRFSSIPSGKCRDGTSITPRTFPSKSFLIDHSSIMLPFDAIYGMFQK
jgi:hypothetical protein